jgi:hypothetical protein
MLSATGLIHLPYTRDLTEGGIAYALRSIPYVYNRMGSFPYDSLRRAVASAAVQLAFRRYLSEQNIPFEVKGAAPFTEHDRYDVYLGRQRCDIQSFLISDRERVSEMRRNPQVLLKAPALVASDLHAGDIHSQFDVYLFAFLGGLITASASELQKVIEAKQPHYLVHVMPEAWNRPRKWNPLGVLVLKSESDEAQTLEIGGQEEGRGMRSCTVELAPRSRVEIQNGFFSLSYVHIKSTPGARVGIRSPAHKETYLIAAQDWGNIWIYGPDIWLAGYITRDEFSRRASFIQPGSHVFQYNTTQVKNLAVPVSDLKPLSELFERVKTQSMQ